MTGNISLSDLKAKRAAMRFTSATTDIITDHVNSANATGIVATHNAADVLIEIAESMLARQQAEMYLQEVQLAWRNRMANRNVECEEALRTARAARDKADIRWREALAKVEP